MYLHARQGWRAHRPPRGIFVSISLLDDVNFHVGKLPTFRCSVSWCGLRYGRKLCFCKLFTQKQRMGMVSRFVCRLPIVKSSYFECCCMMFRLLSTCRPVRP
jgi:hypothetical protein